MFVYIPRERDLCQTRTGSVGLSLRAVHIPQHMISKILLLETATDVCSVAIAAGGEIVAWREQANCPSHIAVITLMIEACCLEAGIALNQLDAVAVSKGPGSYTSLRTGASVAKGLCYALDIPLVAVDTLEALAWGSRPADVLSDILLLPMLDARRDEIWVAAYDGEIQCLVPAAPLILTADALENYIDNLSKGRTWERIIMSGNGLSKLIFEYITNNTDICNIKQSSASFLLEIAQKRLNNKQIEDISLFEPFYMKPPNITISVKPNF